MKNSADGITQFLLNHKVSLSGNNLLHGNHSQLFTLIGILLFTILVIFFLLKLLPFVFQIYKLKKQKTDDCILLQVVIQQGTTESSFATEQLIRNLHSLLRHTT